MKAEITIRDGRAVLVLSDYTGPEDDLLESMRPFLPVTQPRMTNEWIVRGERMPGFTETHSYVNATTSTVVTRTEKPSP